MTVLNFQVWQEFATKQLGTSALQAEAVGGLLCQFMFFWWGYINGLVSDLFRQPLNYITGRHSYAEKRIISTLCLLFTCMDRAFTIYKPCNVSQFKIIQEQDGVWWSASFPLCFLT